MSVTDTPNRLSLSLPIDVFRHIDATIADAQIEANQPIGSGDETGDDWDAVASAIEDAEGQFKRRVGLSSRVSTVGVPGRRETYEQPTYKISGHKTTKGTFTGLWSEYLPEQADILLENDRIVPFDPDEGDEVYFYRGLQDGTEDSWVDLTDEQGDVWQILDHRNGRFTFDPYHLTEYVLDSSLGTYRTLPTFLKRMRFAVSYRHGILDRDSAQVSQTQLATSIDDSETGAVAVDDVEVLSEGRVSRTAILRIGTEYVTATYDRPSGDIQIVERGVRGTSPVAHDSGETVMYVPPEYRKAVASRAAADVASSMRYAAWLPDADDSMDRGEVVDMLAQSWNDITETLSPGPE